MPCYHVHTAFQRADGSVSFVERGGDFVRTLTLACGQCIGCRLERSRQWAVRCMNEAQMHEENSFLTLTYGPKGPVSLVYRDFQLFMKKLRERLKGRRFKYYVAGEYGEEGGRPHFHALLFGVDFPDKKFYKMSPVGFKLYRSAFLESVWDHGFSTVGAVSFESAAYCARYLMKKVNGDLAEAHYTVVDRASGEFVRIASEFNHMSHGLGLEWLKKFESDVYPHGKIVVNGVECKPPRYYDKKFVERGGNDEEMMYRRHLVAKSKHFDNTDERLAVKEEVTTAAASLLKRII